MRLHHRILAGTLPVCCHFAPALSQPLLIAVAALHSAWPTSFWQLMPAQAVAASGSRRARQLVPTLPSGLAGGHGCSAGSLWHELPEGEW